MGVIFARQAEIGKEYLTKSGYPVKVVKVETVKDRVEVENTLSGEPVRIYGADLLFPFDATKINKEAIQMAKNVKSAGKKSAGKGTRGGDRGATKTAEGIVLFRQMGNARHEVLCHGGILTYRTKDYMTLKEVAQAIRGKAVSGSGRSFFGLRSEPNITLGKEVLKELSVAEEKAKAVAKAEAKAKKTPKVKKAKAKKAVAEEDETPEKKATSVGELVASHFSKGRR